MTKVEFETSEEVDVTPTFDTMGLREDLLRGIYAYGARRGAGRGSEQLSFMPRGDRGCGGEKSKMAEAASLALLTPQPQDKVARFTFVSCHR